MSFSPEVFHKKLSQLLETLDLIVSISQWVLFHHRHAKELCSVWQQYTLKTPSSDLKKRLSLLYLCNDVVQQARLKRKLEFVEEFAHILPDTLNRVYPLLDVPIKQKVERLIGVWEQRGVFAPSDIKSMRRGVELLKKSLLLADAKEEAEPALPQKNLVAPELVHLNLLFTNLNRLQELCLSNFAQIGVQAKQYLPDSHSQLEALPLPKVYVAKLNMLEKLCTMTQRTMLEINVSRQDILAALGKLTALVSDAGSADEAKRDAIAGYMARLEETRNDLLDMVNQEAEEDGSRAEEPSPAFVANGSAADDTLPTYENSDSEDEQPQKRRKLSDSKKVAFADEVQVNEYERDDHAQQQDSDDGYDPSALDEGSEKAGLMSLLSKLA